jgi:hypothetical protein
MANKKISALTPKGSALSSTDLLEVSVYNGSTYDTKSLTGANILSGTGLTIGTTAIASGTIGRILFEGTGNVLQQDSTLFWDNTNKRLGVGATPSTSVRLDVRAQGALSTDIAFRVRNSANSADLGSILGNGNFIFGSSSLNWVSNVSGSAELTGTTSARLVGGPTHDRSIFISSTDIWLRHSIVKHQIGGSSVLWKSTYNGNNSVFEIAETTKQSNILIIGSGTGIVTNPTYADAIQIYSKDIVAGNSAPHFRTENGAIIKLYQETTAVTPATVVSGAGGNVKHDDTFDGYTVEQVVKALRNQGLLQ